MSAPGLGVQSEDVEIGKHVCERARDLLSSCKHVRCHGDPRGGGGSKLGLELKQARGAEVVESLGGGGLTAGGVLGRLESWGPGSIHSCS